MAVMLQLDRILCSPALCPSIMHAHITRQPHAPPHPPRPRTRLIGLGVVPVLVLQLRQRLPTGAAVGGAVVLHGAAQQLQRGASSWPKSTSLSQPTVLHVLALLLQTKVKLKRQQTDSLEGADHSRTLQSRRPPTTHLLQLAAQRLRHGPRAVVAGAAAQHEAQADLGGGVGGELVHHASRKVLQRVQHSLEQGWKGRVGGWVWMWVCVGSR